MQTRRHDRLGPWQLSRWIVLAVAVLAWVAVAGQRTFAADNRYALVVGNAAYPTGPLANPVHDAQAVAQSLKSVGFSVVTLVDADQATIRRAVGDLNRKLKGNDGIGLFYFAGHAVQINGSNVLIPISANVRTAGDVTTQGIDLGTVLKAMQRPGTGVNIVILDACRNNPFSDVGGVIGNGLAEVKAPAGTLIAFATAPGEVALDGEGNNSLYSGALAEAIPAPGVVIEEVFRRARRKVLAGSDNQQTPWEHSSLTGEVVLAPKIAAPEASTDRLQGLDRVAVEEIAAWSAIKGTREAEVLRRHIAAYPNGVFAELARVKLDALQARTADQDTGTVAGWSSGVSKVDDTAEKRLEEATSLDARGSAEDLARAFQLYGFAAERGLPAAMFQLARAYDRGRGVGRDVATAARWYEKAADLGHVPSMAALGAMREFGEGVPADLAAALRLYRLAAESGDPGGMTSLGFLYQTGKGVARDPKEARLWYGRAGEKSQARALFNLAVMHVRGEGGERDFNEAVRLLRQAIALGHAGAMRQMAFLYDEGRGVARDPKAAADLLLQAYKAGHPEAGADLLKHPESWSVATRREIHRRLTEKGLYDGRPTGLFDARTRRAIEAFAQKA